MDFAIRQPELHNLAAIHGESGRAIARARNFCIERLVGGAGSRFGFAARTECIVLLPAVEANLSGDRDARLPGHAAVIVPQGAYELELGGAGEAYILATDRSDHDGKGVSPHDARLRPVGTPRRRIVREGEVRIHPVGEIVIPADNGRLRFLQSQTMSINWVEYDGVRDRSGLSPHAHVDFEQASLAIAGEFVHHLRTPWGRDADRWQDDAHLAVGPASVVVIPPEIIHTTEGVGEGHHVLVDVFAPPREDFIARNWVFNANEYANANAAA